MYERIKNLREDRDLTQTDVAKYLNCTQECYSYYENGKRDIPTDILIKLSVLFETSIDYMLGNTDVIKPYPKK
ncbi:MAG: helix-turn-helix transcriptional regulator [Clostridia bacterium]|nr:helix-turn-helix transcriptional regulator [Clostridia bacterium]